MTDFVERTKSVSVEADALKDGSAIVRVTALERYDSHSDRFMSGAFNKVIGKRGQLLSGHAHGGPMPPAGSVTLTQETPEGMEARLDFDDPETNPAAKAWLGYVRNGHPTEFSVRVRAPRSGLTKNEKKGYDFGKDSIVDMPEVSFVMRGSQPGTGVVAVKEDPEPVESPTVTRSLALDALAARMDNRCR